MKKIAGLIFDLDDTLVDTSLIAPLRQKKAWRACVSSLHKTTLYPDVAEFIERARNEKVAIGIVTASVSFYAEAVLRHHGIRYDALVAYHDTQQHKPHPEPALLCLEKMGLEAVSVLGIGDSKIDQISYARAGLISVGAGWSSALDFDADWDHVAKLPSSILKARK